MPPLKLSKIYKGARQVYDQLMGLYLLAVSDLFDKAWYLENNPDVEEKAYNHYLKYGGFEGRDPSPKFDTDWYLDAYKDVNESGINPLVHYLRFGKKEGRLRKAPGIVFAARDKKNPSKQKRDQFDSDFFFIVGTGRSGTTLLAQVLNAHSKIAVPSELQILFEYGNNGERLAEIFQSKKNLIFRAEDYIQLIQSRCPHDLSTYYDYQRFFFEQTYPIHSLQELLIKLYADIAHSQGKSIFGEQTPWYGQNIPLLRELFPEAKFIHMLRDGRDVSISYARTPWWHDDVNLNLQRWEKEVSVIEKDAPEKRLLTVRYEDLVLSPQEKVEEICHFLSVPFEEQMLDPQFHIDYSQYGRDAANNIDLSSSYKDWEKEKRSAFFTGSVHAWKTNTDIEFHELPLSVRQTLERFGYDTD